MKIYHVMKFWSNGNSEGHYNMGTKSTREKAEMLARELCLKIGTDELWGHYIKEEEID